MNQTNVENQTTSPKENKVSILTKLNATQPAQIATLPEVEERFKKVYSLIHGNGARSGAFYEAEKMHFANLIMNNKDLQACSRMSLYGCFMDVAVSGLSFDPSFKHLYMVAFSHNAGTKDSPKWEKRATIMIGGQGELLLRQKQGQIRYADNVVLVYEGDDFKFGTKGGRAFVEHEANLSKRTSKIIAAYVRLTRNDGSTDYKWITQEDMDRFRKFSKDPNSKAWKDGEGGMWQAKCLKHAFKNYPKLRVGDNSKLATETVDTDVEFIETETGIETMHVPDRIDYGIDEDQEQKTTPTPIDDEFVQPAPRPKQTVKHQDDEF